MNITGVIKRLEALKEKHGDLPVYFYNPCCCAEKCKLEESKIKFCEKDEDEGEIYGNEDSIAIGNQFKNEN